MSDDRLKVLLPDPPPPSPEARRSAVEAALARFDEAVPSREGQGSDGGARHKVRTGNGPARNLGTMIMKRRHAIAASLFVAAGGVGAAVYVLDQPGSHRAPDLSRAMVEADLSRTPPPSAQVSELTVGQSSAPAPPAAPSSPPASAMRMAKEQGAARATPRESRPREFAPLAAAPRTMAQADAGRALPSLPERPPVMSEPHGRDQFAGEPENPFRVVREHPVSTFSLDVDTASYAFVRASLNRNALPPKAAVRTEELVNYFPYAYPAPADAREPFRTTVAMFPSPWTEGRRIVHIGIKGFAVQPAERPRANLVFLIDTSGSMNAPNRLPLAKQALAMLVEQLDARDTVAIVTYAGNAGTALEPTPASQKAKILTAIERLEAGGSTAGAEGIRQAYALAEASFDANGVNRVLLATDGDFNVGITSRDELKGFVERKREKGIFLSVLGFGMGNYNDALMQTLAQNGNGAAAYIDTLTEARKTLVEEASSTIIPIAKDVKLQVEFNPAQVAEYRLVGYETRALRREDFNNDKVDAADVGSGHTVTAIYEIVPVGAARVSNDLRYAPAQTAPSSTSNEIGFVSMRYKLPKSDTSQLVTTPIGASAAYARFDDAPQEARFAAAVAGFAELVRGSRHTGALTYDDVIRTATAAKGEDPFGYRAEFVQLVRAAKTAAAMQALPR
jgi:Ca-activated chloride channel family protein